MKKQLVIIIALIFISACEGKQFSQDKDDSIENKTDTEVESVVNEESNAEEKIEDLNLDEQGHEEDAIVEKKDLNMAIEEFTYEAKRDMTQSFYNWAVERAKIGNMAVTTRYFEHGAGGIGDWYAVTPDGEVQTQNHDNPGFGHFDIHAIGGVAFYQPLSGDYGIDEKAPTVGFAEGYHRLAVEGSNINKYMLADNGVVYELIAKKENMSFSTGFGEYADDGTRGDFKPTVQFKISEDQDAQQEWRRILGTYHE